MPRLWEDRGVGSIMVMRQPPSPFSDKEIAAHDFRRQAVIAVAAALEMIELIEQFNLERSAAQKPTVRIGIATGEVVAGYTGTQQRATYTCIGDTVNLAARLEAHTKVAGRGILIGEDTRRAL